MDIIKSLVKPYEALEQFGIVANTVTIIPIHQGLINHTWKIETGKQAYILQKINHAVFKKPEDVAHNISSIAAYLVEHEPGYIFAAPVKTINGETLYKDGEQNYFRLFYFIEGSYSRSTVETAEQAYEAAKQFGKFTAILKYFDASSLKTSIPFFHDIGLRYQQFLDILKHGNTIRIEAAKQLITGLKKYASIVDQFKKICADPQFKLRVTHHDTKISNVLFDKDHKGICVIDLDTVMPGYFISDVGDMMRTYISPVTEEEKDIGKIQVRPEIYKAIVKGYMEEMEEVLSEKEKQHFFYAGSFMIYMQALRFLTDHLNNDTYYGAAYEGQNFKRAANQFALLQQFMLLKDEF